MKKRILKPIVQLIKIMDLGSAVAVRLTKLTGKSKEPIHPKHFLTQKPWFLQYITKKDIVLDLGSGNGQNSIKAAQIAKSVYGLEYDLNLIKIAKSSATHRQVNNVFFDKGDLEQKLDFKDKSFDKVIFLDVLEHLHKRDQILSEIHRILKPKGIALIGVPSSDTSWKKFQETAGVCSFSDPDHKVEFTEKELRALLVKHKFKIEKFQYGTFDLPLRGLIDIVGGFSLSAYKNIYKFRQTISKKYPSQASGFEVVAGVSQ